MSEDNDTPDEDFTAVVPEPQEEKSPAKKSSGGLKFLTLLMLIAAIGLFVFPFVWGLEGNKMEVSPDSSVLNDWMRCMGDLHLVILHVPIGIFVYVLTMEVLALFSFGRFKPQLRGALFLNVISGIVAVVFGYFYFLSGDENAPLKFAFEGNSMGMHMWLSILFVAFVTLAFISKMWAHHQNKWSPFYPFFLLIAAASMTVGTHFGAKMVHPNKDITGDFIKLKNGEPLGVAAEEVTKLPAVTDIPAGERLVYAEIIKPILYGKCWECHAPAELNPLGEKKIKGDLEMTSVAKLLKGGKNAKDFPTLVPGNAKESEMIVRVHLGLDDDDFMPSGKEDEPKMHFTDGEKRILAWWIDTKPLIDEENDQPLAEVAGHEAILADVQAFKPVRESAVVGGEQAVKAGLVIPSPAEPKVASKEEEPKKEDPKPPEPTKNSEQVTPLEVEKKVVPALTPKVDEANKPAATPKKEEPKKDSVEVTPEKETAQPIPVPEKKVMPKPVPTPSEEPKKEEVKPVPASEEKVEAKPEPTPEKEELKAEPVKEAKPALAPEKKEAPKATPAPRPEEKAEPKPTAKEEEVKPAPVAPKNPVEKEEAEAPKKVEVEAPKLQTPEERAKEAIKKLREAASVGD